MSPATTGQKVTIGLLSALIVLILIGMINNITW